MKTVSALCVIILALSGCTSSTYTAKGKASGSSPTSAHAGPSYGAPSYAPNSAPQVDAKSSSGDHRLSVQGEAAASDSLGRQAPQSPPQDRPGLGTVWGENRTSHVEHKHFDRAAPYPTSTLALYYNDEQGVRAQVEYNGLSGMNPVQTPTLGGGVTVMLKDQSGRVLPGARIGDRTYVVGQAGNRYSLVFTNQTGGRFEVVASVDGLDVIDGRPASPDKRGYLLDPHSTLEIDGFRTSDQAVAAFRFGKVKDSYAARTSGDRNVGVIGLAFFQEKGSQWTTEELHRRNSADPFPGRYATPPAL